MSYRFLCRDGSARWTETTSRRFDAGAATLVVSAVRDITERQGRTHSLERQAFTDSLTGVANRTVLMDRLRQGLRRLDRSEGVLAVLYLDLDRFKVVNHSLGHRVGDSVLLQMAERLENHLRPADTLARLGGDEFVIVAEGMTDEQAAIDFGKRVTEAGRQPFRVGDEDVVCTVSVGVACASDSQRSADDLLGEADLALYRAKDRGRDGDPDRGLLQPDEFLEVAEETGLLIAMDERVLADAVRQVSASHTRLAGTGFTEVSINVTARHLADAGFQRAVLDELARHAVSLHHLQIEVTERVLLEASNSALTGLRALSDAGVQVGLDDFGTGYSSLGYLLQFPLDFVKIDRCFVHGIERDQGERAIVAAIIGLSHALHLFVVAEGVETEGQLRVLDALECDRAQGFLFAASAAPWAIDHLVRARSKAS